MLLLLWCVLNVLLRWGRRRRVHHSRLHGSWCKVRWRWPRMHVLLCRRRRRLPHLRSTSSLIHGRGLVRNVLVGVMVAATTAAVRLMMPASWSVDSPTSTAQLRRRGGWGRVDRTFDDALHARDAGVVRWVIQGEPPISQRSKRFFGSMKQRAVRGVQRAPVSRRSTAG